MKQCSRVKARTTKYEKPIATITVPTLVEELSHEKICKVSCGVSHTAALSVIQDNRDDPGGRVYVCGSAHALGKFTPVFKHVDALDEFLIKDISCGSAHTAAVTTRGELYTWGSNVSGCLGHPIAYKSVRYPALVRCMNIPARNLALNKVAYQSSTHGECEVPYCPRFGD